MESLKKLIFDNKDHIIRYVAVASMSALTGLLTNKVFEVHEEEIYEPEAIESNTYDSANEEAKETETTEEEKEN